MSVVVCTDILGEEAHRQRVVGKVLTLGSLGGVMVSTLAQNARDISSIRALSATFPNFITLHDTTRSKYQFGKSPD